MNNQSKDVMLVKISPNRDPEWVSAFKEVLPDLEIRVWPFVGDPKEINLALLWDPPDELFSTVGGLDVIFSVGAGVDHLIECSEIPTDVPIVRMIDVDLTAGMVEYILYHVLRIHRNMDSYFEQNLKRQWAVLPYKPANELCVGIMGVGELGSAVASSLHTLGYQVQGWSRTPKSLPGIQSLFGISQLSSFLAETNILVILLPLTNATTGIISLDRLMELPLGSYVINAGRGLLIVEDDLLLALELGHISGAALDVFGNEPLPVTHKFWTNEKVFVTPHIASLTNPATAVASIAKNIKRHKEGATMKGLIDINDYR
jgi:glyoxylate/hydroxypyruvate reductase A